MEDQNKLKNLIKTLVLIPSYLPDTAALAAYLKSRFGDVTYISFEELDFFGNDFAQISISGKAERQQLIASMSHYNTIILASPSAMLLKRLVCNEAEGYLGELVTRAILCQQRLLIILDFSFRTVKQTKMLSAISEAIADLEEAGAEIIALNQENSQEYEGLSLITEAEIIAFGRRGEKHIKCSAKAIITPLAKDKARELGIRIN